MTKLATSFVILCALTISGCAGISVGAALATAASVASAGATLYVGNKMLKERNVTVVPKECLLPRLKLDDQTIDHATQKDVDELLTRDKWYKCHCQSKQEFCPSGSK